MGDSCIGGKTSINFDSYKNQLGNFYPPDKIFIDVSFLDGLGDREIRSGVGEMAHYFLVSGEDEADFFVNNFEKALAREMQILQELIFSSLTIKKHFIEKDEFDTDYRLLLNYGHTFGHAIEAVTNYQIPHGVAVSHGMNMANFWSLKKNYINSDQFLNLNQVLSIIWKDIIPNKFEINDFISILKMDKKCIGEDLRLVLTKGVGKMFLETTPIDNLFLNFIKEYNTKYFGE